MPLAVSWMGSGAAGDDAGGRGVAPLGIVSAEEGAPGPPWGRGREDGAGVNGTRFAVGSVAGSGGLALGAELG